MVRVELFVNFNFWIGLNKVINRFLSNPLKLIEYSLINGISCFRFTGVPKSGEGFIDFIGQVHKTKEQFGLENSPITIHCSAGMFKLGSKSLLFLTLIVLINAGVGRTGVFITLSIVLERMQYEGVLDVFQTVRILRSQRIHMVQTEVNTREYTFKLISIAFIHDLFILILFILFLFFSIHSLQILTGSISILLSSCSGILGFI